MQVLEENWRILEIGNRRFLIVWSRPSRPEFENRHSVLDNERRGDVVAQEAVGEAEEPFLLGPP